MGGLIESENIILLFDNYLNESQKLHTSFKMSGKNYPVAVIDDDGFLPDDVISVYGYFLGEFYPNESVPGKPRYFNQVNVPESWEIRGTNSGGSIYEMNKERGKIFFAKPTHKRLVKVVDWYDDRGIVRSSDHYNKNGALYARTIFNAKGQRVNKSFFSSDGKEIITENYVTRDIILNDDNIVRLFHSKAEFVTFFLKRAGMEKRRIFFNTLSTSFFVSQLMSQGEKKDVLFWQEPVGEQIPDNMKIILNGTSKNTEKIMVQQRKAYSRLLELGAATEKLNLLGYVYPYVKENKHKPEVLVCTNSDRLAQCEYLIKSLPGMHFHITALTEMSSKLMSMGRFDNVSLYPGVRLDILDELFMKCDYYLDINYEGEIVSAVEKAFLHNQLILAFRETMHNPCYVSEENIYSITEAEKMVEKLKKLLLSDELMNVCISNQQSFALSENIYLQI